MTKCPTCNQTIITKSLNGKVIALDAGHGWGKAAGFDVGALGNGANEQALNAEVARLAKDMLEDKGATVHLFDYTSEDSPRLFLRDKGLRAGKVNAHIFVSIHHNAFNGSVNGTETLVDDDATQEDLRLAKAIQTELLKSLNYPNRGVKKQPLGILKGCPVSIPACLTEGFFIDWRNFNGKIPKTVTENYAAGIVAGIEDYFTQQ